MGDVKDVPKAVLYLGADAMVLHVANSFHQRQPEGSATLADYLGS